LTVDAIGARPRSLGERRRQEEVRAYVDNETRLVGVDITAPSIVARPTSLAGENSETSGDEGHKHGEATTRRICQERTIVAEEPGRGEARERGEVGHEQRKDTNRNAGKDAPPSGRASRSLGEERRGREGKR
jgi:hypothetical protein